MVVDKISDSSKDISLTFQNVDGMTDEQFKECIAKLFNVKYNHAAQMKVRCNRRETSTPNSQVIDVDLMVRY